MHGPAMVYADPIKRLRQRPIVDKRTEDRAKVGGTTRFFFVDTRRGGPTPTYKFAQAENIF